MPRYRSASDVWFLAMAATALLAAAPARAASLYDALGGQPGLTRIVGDLFVIAVKDPRINGELDNINVERLKSRIVLQFCVVTGGGCKFRAISMRGAHRGLGITQYHFNALVEDLEQAMDHAEIPFSTQNRLLARLAPMQRDIVTR